MAGTESAVDDSPGLGRGFRTLRGSNPGGASKFSVSKKSE
jgi:hypothetical protein